MPELHDDTDTPEEEMPELHDGTDDAAAHDDEVLLLENEMMLFYRTGNRQHRFVKNEKSKKML